MTVYVRVSHHHIIRKTQLFDGDYYCLNTEHLIRNTHNNIMYSKMGGLYDDEVSNKNVKNAL